MRSLSPLTFFPAASLVALSGCATVHRGAGGYCAPPVMAASAALVPDPPPAPGAPHEAQMAALLGLGAVKVEGPGRTAEERATAVERVELATLILEATAAELDCEGERAEQAADYLSRGQSSTVQSLTIGSIAAAAVTSIAGVLLSTSNRPSGEQDGVAIGGGVVTAGLGLGSLFVHSHADFGHPRNLLTDVWQGPDTPATYPAFVWGYLTRAEFSNDKRAPIREKIVARWKHFRQVEDRESALLLFGRGGSYDADLLRTRAAMLDEVKAEVELEYQDLEAFAAAALR